MKKILVTMLLVTVLAFALIIPALAEAAGDIGTGVTSPFSWNYLLTIGGATAATLLIVQFIKAPLDKVWKISTRAVVYVIALALLLAATAFTTGITLQGFVLTLLNAVVVSTAAYGSYELTFKKLE